MGRREGKGDRYPEEGSACPGYAGQLHRDAKTPVQHVLSRARQFGHGNESILRDSAAHPELQARIPAQDALARPAVIVFERVGDDIAESCVLAVGSASVGSRDGVVLRLPVGVEGDVGEVQKVGFKQVGVEG